MDSRNTSVFMGEILSSSPQNEKEKIMEQSQEYCSKWVELPDHITEMISNRLGFPDILRFGSVCKPWRSVSNETRRHRCSLSSQQSYVPMVLFEYNLKKGTFGFFSFEEGKVYWISLDIAPASQCLGCYEGWLVMLSPYLPNCFVLNPFTGTRIDLPCFNNLGVDISKVIFLSNPLDITSKKPNFDCTVVALNSLKTELNMCRLGDESCTIMKLDGHGQILGSLIFYKGEIYVMSRSGELWTVNLAGPKPSAHKREIVFPEIISSSLHEYQVECYLVESEENLLLILRFKKKRVRKTVKFMIYRLVESAAEYMLERVPFLADDQVLFVGRFCSKSVSTSQWKGLQGNSIYFTDDKVLKYKKGLEYPEKGIFNVKTGNIGPYNLSFDLYPFDMPHIWITPSI
ncbi:probable F-box protein At4g22060 [Telopea speciosissima]|uniref:probable F-box protein At4g22060 n=1 Tax=Telopea speciosissima TaxID=54955 RepID=UPI001CC46DF2|nr:probable F-box protein At4g22060 [Telopea speciosissima]